MTEYTSANTISDLIRSILVTIIDRPGFLLLGIMYEIFFNVATSEILSSSTIKHFYYRIQLIIGVFMIFKLSITILESIVNPEKLTAKKTGTMSIIGRVFISLALLAVITPINIPHPESASSYEKQLYNNGILFGTLYSLQDRILSNNTLGRLILGTTDNADTNLQGDRLSDKADSFASAILKVFVRINLVPKEARELNTTGSPDDDNPTNYVCPDATEAIEFYESTTSPQEILSLVNLGCGEASNSRWKDLSFIGKLFAKAEDKLKKLAFSEKYVFAYMPLGGIVALVFAFILLGFTVDIAIRSIKLAVLRLIAPIPVISYMSPNAKDNGALGTWAKSLSSTYLDLFIRLGIVYLVLYLISDILDNGLVINTNGGLIGGISFILICLGLFLFARQAPKFIKDALGIKGGGMSNFGLNGMLAAAGAARMGGSGRDIFEAMNDSATTSIDAINQGKAPMAMGQGFTFGQDNVAKTITGNSNATAKGLKRGIRHLKDMGILYTDHNGVNRNRSELYDTYAKNVGASAEKYKDMYDLIRKDRTGANLTQREKSDLASKGFGTYNSTTGAYNIDDNQIEALKKYVGDLDTSAKKVSKKAEKMDKEINRYYANRTYEAKNTDAMFGGIPYAGGPYEDLQGFRQGKDGEKP